MWSEPMMKAGCTMIEQPHHREISCFNPRTPRTATTLALVGVDAGEKPRLWGLRPELLVTTKLPERGYVGFHLSWVVKV